MAVFLFSRSYRIVKARGVSVRTLRDAALTELVKKFHQANYGAYDIREMWRAPRRDCTNVGYKRNARLMFLAWFSAKVIEPTSGAVQSETAN